MSEIKRPREVVIIDAENPMEEIHGEFFWREDHERVVAAAREASFRDEFSEGYAAGVAQRPRAASVGVRLRGRRVLARILICLVAGAYLTTLIASFLR
jgi:hypothetical protein